MPLYLKHEILDMLGFIPASICGYLRDHVGFVAAVGVFCTRFVENVPGTAFQEFRDTSALFVLSMSLLMYSMLASAFAFRGSRKYKAQFAHLVGFTG